MAHPGVPSGVGRPRAISPAVLAGWTPREATRAPPEAALDLRIFARFTSGDTDICVQPEFTHLEDGHTGILLHIRKKARRTSGEAEAQQLRAASSTDAKVLGGAISAFAREGKRMIVTVRRLNCSIL